MIKIYSEKDIKDIEKIINNEEIWSFSIEEIDYLLLEHKEESFVLINNRLYEIESEEK